MNVIKFIGQVIGSAVIVTVFTFVFLTFASGGMTITMIHDAVHGRVNLLEDDKEYRDSLLKVQEEDFVKLGIPRSMCKPIEF